MSNPDYTPEVEEMVRLLDRSLFMGRNPFSVDGDAAQYYYTIREWHDEQLAEDTWNTAYGIFKAHNPEWFKKNEEVDNV